jgi:hypothetical protein
MIIIIYSSFIVVAFAIEIGCCTSGFKTVKGVNVGGNDVGLIRFSIVRFLVLYDYHLLEGTSYGA